MAIQYMQMEMFTKVNISMERGKEKENLGTKMGKSTSEFGKMTSIKDLVNCLLITMLFMKDCGSKVKKVAKESFFMGITGILWEILKMI